MTDLPPALTELIKDEDRERTKDELLAFIRRLQEDGVKNRSILKALHDVMMIVCEELPSANQQYHFLEFVRDCAQDGVELFEMFVEKDKSTEH
jgi:hypothetical protein